MRDPFPIRPSTPPPSAATQPTNSLYTTPSSPSKLSSHATPFFPSPVGRSKCQRWLDSPFSPHTAQSTEAMPKPSYRDIVVKGLASLSKGDPGKMARPPPSPPPHPLALGDPPDPRSCSGQRGLARGET